MDLISGIFTNLAAFFLLAIGFGFLIFVHELGHFLVAKWVGIKVSQFALGFGQALFSYRKGMGVVRGSSEGVYFDRLEKYLQEKGVKPEGKDDEGKPVYTDRQASQAAAALKLSETEYRFNWMPLGGYVKMLGQEDMDPTARSEDPRAFNNKSFGARAAVISAGVIMNLIFGVVFFTICFTKGVDFPPPIVGEVVPDSPAAMAFAAGKGTDAAYQGLQPGDRLISLNDKPIEDFIGLQLGAALASPGSAIRLEIERDGQRLIYEIVPAMSADTGMLYVGVRPPRTAALYDQTTLDQAGQHLPLVLREQGVEPGMHLIRADSREVTQFEQASRAITAARGGAVDITFRDPERAGSEVSLPVRALPMLKHPRTETEPESHLAGLGIVPLTAIAETLPGRPADAGGLKPGDVLLRVGPYRYPTMRQAIEVINRSPGQPLEITVLRGSDTLDFNLTPYRQRDGMFAEPRGLLGFVPAHALETNTLQGLTEDSPLQSLQLQSGSRILQVNDTPTATLREVAMAVEQAVQDAGEADTITLRITYELALKDRPVPAPAAITLTREQADAVLSARWGLPLFVPEHLFEPMLAPVKRSNPLGAALLGFEKTHEFMLQTYLTLARLFQGTVPVSGLRGPIGIAEIGTDITRDRGWPYLLFFLGLISVNLAVINFLPIPIVDGGLMIFLIIEKIKGSPVSPAVLNAANIAGLALIATLFLVVTFHDASRLLFRLFS